MPELSEVLGDYFSGMYTSWLLSKSLRYSHIFVPASELAFAASSFVVVVILPTCRTTLESTWLLFARCFSCKTVCAFVEMTCAYLELPEDTERRQMWLRLLDETRLLVGYLYSTPDTDGNVFFSSEDSALFTFRVGDTALHPGMVSTSLVWQDQLHQDRVVRVDSKILPQDMLTPGYVAIRDFNVHFWVAEGSRIYPEVPLVRLNRTQNLSSNLKTFLSHAHNWALERLYCLPYQPTPEVSSRVFVAIDWYLRSCRGTIAEPEAIVDLAIALESVLGLRSGDRVTERFKDAVLTLLGPVPRLDSWLDQFYTARSKAVHEGMPHETMFYAVTGEDLKKKQGRDDAIAHRSLLAYGRHIFRLCLNSILSGVAITERVGLGELFIHNKERIEAIFKALNEKNALPLKRLLNASRYVLALKEFSTDIMEPLVDVKAALGAARLILQVYKDTNPELASEAVSALDAVLAASTAQASVQLKGIEECVGACTSEHGRTGILKRCTRSIPLLPFWITSPRPDFNCGLIWQNTTPPVQPPMRLRAADCLCARKYGEISRFGIVVAGRTQSSTWTRPAASVLESLATLYSCRLTS